MPFHFNVWQNSLQIIIIIKKRNKSKNKQIGSNWTYKQFSSKSDFLIPLKSPGRPQLSPDLFGSKQFLNDSEFSHISK